MKFLSRNLAAAVVAAAAVSPAFAQVHNVNAP